MFVFCILTEFECPGQCTYLYEGQTEVSKTTSLIIKNLKPYTQYSFNVQGFSTQGAGVLSKGVVVRTLQSGEFLLFCTSQKSLDWIKFRIDIIVGKEENAAFCPCPTVFSS